MTIEQIFFYVWLGVFILSIIIEFLTPELVSIWFGLSAIVSLILSAIPGIPYYVTIIIFTVLSLGLLLLVRPLAKKLLLRQEVKSNVDEMIGKKAVVIKKISELERGEVKINGVVWTAQLSSNSKESIEVEKIVCILAIEGNRLIVRELY